MVVVVGIIGVSSVREVVQVGQPAWWNSRVWGTVLVLGVSSSVPVCNKGGVSGAWDSSS